MGQNFDLEGTSMTAEEFGNLLASGEDFDGSSNLRLMGEALRNLIDPYTADRTRQGEKLMRPFHSSFLWYDARWGNGKYTTRKVLMRGQGVTLARVLMSPSSTTSQGVRETARSAVQGLKRHLEHPTPLARICEHIDSSLGAKGTSLPELETDEIKAWEAGADSRLGDFTELTTRHLDGVVSQGGASSAAVLWQARSLMAMNVALNAVKSSWERCEVGESERSILIASPGQERTEDRVRLAAERSLALCRASMATAIMNEIQVRLTAEVANDPDRPLADLFRDLLPKRTGKAFFARLEEGKFAAGDPDYVALSQLLFENVEGYRRSIGGFRQLLDSIGMVFGGTRYSYLGLTADLLSSLVGALSREMPMTSEEFFLRLSEDWGLVVSPMAAEGAWIGDVLDGDDLALNAKRYERLLVESGLASNLSDRTVLVGETAGRNLS